LGDFTGGYARFSECLTRGWFCMPGTTPKPAWWATPGPRWLRAASVRSPGAPLAQRPPPARAA
jgi:hypothetical protein